ncbi:hypothetical protein FJZ28_01535 [Candidatus Peregrinibacteria bacterium]|nr:hypothetical protein [Candidatus Peregrinibacteria bacterium]
MYGRTRRSILISLSLLLPLTAHAETNNAYKLCVDNATQSGLIAIAQIDQNYFTSVSSAYSSYITQLQAITTTDISSRKQQRKNAKTNLSNQLKSIQETRVQIRKNAKTQEKNAKAQCKALKN